MEGTEIALDLSNPTRGAFRVAFKRAARPDPPAVEAPREAAERSPPPPAFVVQEEDAAPVPPERLLTNPFIPADVPQIDGVRLNKVLSSGTKKVHSTFPPLALTTL